MDAAHIADDLIDVLFTEEDIHRRLGELAAEVERDYEGKDLLIVGVLRGAVMVMADLARSFSRHHLGANCGREPRRERHRDGAHH